MLAPFNFSRWIEEHAHLLKPPVGNQMVFREAEDLIVMAIGGPNARTDYHDDPYEEFFYQLRGDIVLKVMENGAARDVPIREGEILHCPAGTPHSPRFAPDSFVLVLERKRRAAEQDRFLWYCPACGARLYEAARQVGDWRDDPVSEVYADFYSAESHRTCGKCGHVTPLPAD